MSQIGQMDDILYRKQCQQWHLDLLTAFETNNSYNLRGRLDEIEKIVNRECVEYYSLGCGQRFIIGASQRRNLQTLCNKDLREHTMVSYDKCSKQINDIDDYKKKARNKLNRWKPKVFGEHVLYQIIFIDVYNHCCSIGRSAANQWDDDNINSLFVTMFMELLDAKIRFKKTRDVSLILATSFSANTRFRSACINFLQHFNALNSWNHKRGTAADKRNSFRTCLESIRQYRNIVIPPPIIMDAMDISDMDRNCDVTYFHLVQKVIRKSEEEECLFPDERISSFIHILKVICEYHHDSVRFWTVTPPKAPQESTRITFIDEDVYDIPRAVSNTIDNLQSEYDAALLPAAAANNNYLPVQLAQTISNDSQQTFNIDEEGDININETSLAPQGYYTYGTSLAPPVNYYGTNPPQNISRHNSAQSVLSGAEYLAPNITEYNDSQMYNGFHPQSHPIPHITEQLPPPPHPHSHAVPHFMVMTNDYHHGPNPPLSQELPPPPPPLSQQYDPRSYGIYHEDNIYDANCNIPGCGCRYNTYSERESSQMQLDSAPNQMYIDDNAHYQGQQQAFYDGSRYLHHPMHCN